MKVLDFGMARRVPTPRGRRQGIEGSTIPGRPIGTASYMAPERILQLPLDARCDLFSLGVVIYEMATGRLPFAGASPGETVTNILDKQPTPLTTLSSDRPGQLHRIVNKLVAKHAAIVTALPARYASISGRFRNERAIHSSNACSAACLLPVDADFPPILGTRRCLKRPDGDEQNEFCLRRVAGVESTLPACASAGGVPNRNVTLNDSGC